MREQVRLDNSSLASQAVGPPMNAVEMSYEGRTWSKLGKRLLGLRALALQNVDPEDSVLGHYANAEGRRLSAAYTYLALVQAAFRPEYWNFSEVADTFALFFGLAVQAYQATLVSADSPSIVFPTVTRARSLRRSKRDYGCSSRAASARIVTSVPNSRPRVSPAFA